MSDEKKRRTDAELLEISDTSFLTSEELSRYAMLFDIDVKKRQMDQFRMKDSERKDKFFSRGRELIKTTHDQEIQQKNCSHRKGGRGLEGILKGGNASDYAVIRHLLPWNEWYQRCQRCGKTWKPAREEDFDMKSAAGREAFAAAKKEYQEALSWPTDNIPSTGITFKHDSDDDNKTAKAFVRDTIKDVNLR